jgi:dienelactone hydrolase
LKEEVMVLRKLILAGLFLMLTCAAVQTITAQAVTIPTRAEGGLQLQLPGVLHKPVGDGPFPAVLLLVGCEGIAQPDPPDAQAQAQWVDRLVGWGYVTLLLDSFTPRGHIGICEDVGLVGPETRSQDAYAAKAWLSALPFVDASNIGVIGWSHGGWAIMTIIDAASRDKSASPFKAAVAFYPFCHPLVNPDTPVLTLIGRKDDWCPASFAESLGRDYKNWGWKPEFSLTVYPNATHAFDVEGFKGGIDFGSHHMDYDAKATADAIAQTRSFLAKYMAPR